MPWNWPSFALVFIGLLAGGLFLLGFWRTDSNFTDLKAYWESRQSIFGILGVVGTIATLFGIYLSSKIYNETSEDTGKMKGMIKSLEDGLRTKPEGAVNVVNGVHEFLKSIVELEEERNKVKSAEGDEAKLILLFDVPNFYSVYELLPNHLKSGVSETTLIRIRSKVDMLLATTDYKFAVLDDNSEFSHHCSGNQSGGLDTSALSSYIEEIRKMVGEGKMVEYADKKGELQINLKNDLRRLGYSETGSPKDKAEKPYSLVQELPFQAIVYKDKQRNIYKAFIIYLGSYNVENLTHPLAFWTEDKDLVKAYYSILETFIQEQNGLVLVKNPRKWKNNELVFYGNTGELNKENAAEIVRAYIHPKLLFANILLLDENFNIIDLSSYGSDSKLKTPRGLYGGKLKTTLPSAQVPNQESDKVPGIDENQEMVNMIVDQHVKFLIEQYDSKFQELFLDGLPSGKSKRLSMDVEQVAYFVGNIVTEDHSALCKYYVVAYTGERHLVNDCKVRFGYLIGDLRKDALGLPHQASSSYGKKEE